MSWHRYSITLKAEISETSSPAKPVPRAKGDKPPPASEMKKKIKAKLEGKSSKYVFTDVTVTGVTQIPHGRATTRKRTTGARRRAATRAPRRRKR